MSNLEERNKSLSFGSMHTVSSDGSMGSGDPNPQLVAEAEEIIPNPMISKKGCINFFNQPECKGSWSKCYVVR